MDAVYDLVEQIPDEIVLYAMAFSMFALALIVFLVALRSPFKYPYFICSIDITGKRNVIPEDIIDNYLNGGNMMLIDEHEEKIDNWKFKSKRRTSASTLMLLRKWQYKHCLDDNNAYQFNLIRKQTRYVQHNYMKVPYLVPVTEKTCCFSYEYLAERDRQLSEIDYSCTLRQYESKNQRKLMTKSLRKKIMERDQYTCQICGKYMPDQVGLHIDHIIPVSKGGKSIPQNLQVLCDKCNGHKLAKIV